MPNVTLTHRLITPVDTNHHGTLYAGSLMRITLEAAYATAFNFIGHDANLLIAPRADNRMLQAGPLGAFIEIKGTVLHVTRAYLITGLIGTPLPGKSGPWMDALLGFVQVNDDGRAAEFPGDLSVDAPTAQWKKLHERMKKLLRIRGRNGGEWLE